MDYVLESAYISHVLEQYSNQQHMQRYIEECIAIAEGKNFVNKIRTLNEDAGDKIKQGWEKFTAFINKIWQKFVENVTRIFNTDVGYLEKYKDIILNKKLKPSTFTMKEFNIGLQRIANKSVPVLSTNILDKINTNPDDPGFKKFIIGDYNPKVDFTDFCKEYFQGGEQEKDFNEHSINMTDLFNFCRDKRQIMNNIEKDQKTLINSSRAAEAILKERLGGMNQSNQNQQNNQQTKQENFLFRKDSVYSVVYEQYINEADGVKITNPDGSSNGGNNTNNQQSAANTANNNTQTNPASGNNLKNNTNRNVDMNHDTDNKQQSDDKLGKEDIQSLDKKIQIYNSVCSTVLTAKMTAVTIIYKAYMTIIKKHVKDYVGGSDNTADNTMAKTGTDYSNKQVQLTNAQKSDIEDNIAQAEQETDESKKLDLQKAAIESLRKADSNFKGGYEAVKQYVGYKS